MGSYTFSIALTGVKFGMKE